MPRGTGIAKRGFGKALPRVGYADGSDEEGVQPGNLKDELEGVSGLILKSFLIFIPLLLFCLPSFAR